MVDSLCGSQETVRVVGVMSPTGMLIFSGAKGPTSAAVVEYSPEMPSGPTTVCVAPASLDPLVDGAGRNMK